MSMPRRRGRPNGYKIGRAKAGTEYSSTPAAGSAQRCRAAASADEIVAIPTKMAVVDKDTKEAILRG